MRITIKSTATGEVLRWLDVPDDAVELQVGEGEEYVEGWPNPIPQPSPQGTVINAPSPPS